MKYKYKSDALCSFYFSWIIFRQKSNDDKTWIGSCRCLWGYEKSDENSVWLKGGQNIRCGNFGQVGWLRTFLNFAIFRIGKNIWHCMYSKDYLNRKFTNSSSTETKTNRESMKMTCVCSYPTVRRYPIFSVLDKAYLQ